MLVCTRNSLVANTIKLRKIQTNRLFYILLHQKYIFPFHYIRNFFPRLTFISAYFISLISLWSNPFYEQDKSNLFEFLDKSRSLFLCRWPSQILNSLMHEFKCNIKNFFRIIIKRFIHFCNIFCLILIYSEIINLCTYLIKFHSNYDDGSDEILNFIYVRLKHTSYM